MLTGVMLQLEPAQPEAARGAVRRAHSLDEVRRIARELRPEMLDDLGLLSALRALPTPRRTRACAWSGSSTSATSS